MMGRQSSSPSFPSLWLAGLPTIALDALQEAALAARPAITHQIEELERLLAILKVAVEQEVQAAVKQATSESPTQYALWPCFRSLDALNPPTPSAAPRPLPTPSCPLPSQPPHRGPTNTREGGSRCRPHKNRGAVGC
jgi:hypothetical protein